MRENRFIYQNKEKWAECESLLNEKSPDPDRLSRIYIQITDDLSFARTFYPNRSVRVYLNNLARRLYHRVNQYRKKQKNPISRFWTDELPLTIYQNHRLFLVSLLTFALAMAIGIFSSSQDPDFARQILGDQYVAMTEANIEKGEPMEVYKSSKPGSMFLVITLNNIKVALLTFLFGALFVVGCLGILLSNGIMVGTFQHFFIERDLFRESFLTIWQHGTLEISSIVIAGAAGLVMGHGLLFPGTYSRLQSFRLSAIRGLKIFLGTIPIFIMAAFIEGFVTRFTGLPDGIRIFTILFSLGFILIYFVWYPRYVAKVKDPSAILQYQKIPPQTPYQMEYYSIKSVGQVFNDTIQYLKENGAFFMKLTAGVAILQVLAIQFLWDPLTAGEAVIDKVYGLWYIQKYQLASFLPISVLGMASIAWFSHSRLQQSFLASHNPEQRFTLFQTGKSNLLGYLVVTGLCFSLLVVPTGWGYVLFLVALPLTIISLFAALHNNTNAFRGIGIFFSYLGHDKGKIILFFLIFLIAALLFYFFLNTPLAYFYTQFIAWNIPNTVSWGPSLLDMILLFTRITIFNLVYVVALIGFGILAFSLKEITEAPDLLNRIEKMAE